MKQRGFTLLELLIVLALVSALAFAALRRAPEARSNHRYSEFTSGLSDFADRLESNFGMGQNYGAYTYTAARPFAPAGWASATSYRNILNGLPLSVALATCDGIANACLEITTTFNNATQCVNIAGLTHPRFTSVRIGTNVLKVSDESTVSQTNIANFCATSQQITWTLT